MNDDVKAVIESDVKNAAYEIISRKNATYFAVALAVNRIVEAILRDENTILTVSCLMQGEYGINDVYLAVPTILNSTGAVRIVNPILKDEEELKKLRESAKVLKENIQKVMSDK